MAMAATHFEAVYNELTHTNLPNSNINGLDPMYHWDTHFPERMSRLHMNPEYASPVARRSRKGRQRDAARFKTQPITFDEIKEVDEETVDEAAKAKLYNKEGLKNQFSAFSRSMDGLMPSLTYAIKNAPECIKPLRSDSKEAQDGSSSPAAEPGSELRLKTETSVMDRTCKSDNSADTTSSSRVMTQQLPAHLLSADISRQKRQKRFKKKQRHSRSIEEEVPEMDKNEADQAVR